MKTSTTTALLVLVVAALGAAHAGPIIPHMDPLAAKAQMTRRQPQQQHPPQPPQPPQPPAQPQPQPTTAPQAPAAHGKPAAAPMAFVAAAAVPLHVSAPPPPPPSTPTTAAERRAAFEAYRAKLTQELAARREDDLRRQYPHAGPWEMIADHEYGVRVIAPAPQPPDHPPFHTQPIKPVVSGGVESPHVLHLPPATPATAPPPAPAAASPPSPPPPSTAPASQTTPAAVAPASPTPPVVPPSPQVVAAPSPAKPATAPPPPPAQSPAVPPTTPPANPPPPPTHPGIAERLSQWVERLRGFRDRWWARARRQPRDVPPPTTTTPAPEVKPQSVPAPPSPTDLTTTATPDSKPSGTGATKQQKPFLTHDQVMHEIRRFNGIIAANKAKRAAAAAAKQREATMAHSAAGVTTIAPTAATPPYTTAERVEIAKAAFAAANAHRLHTPPTPAPAHTTQTSWAQMASLAAAAKDDGAMVERHRGFHRHRHHHPTPFERRQPPNPNEPIRFALKFTGRCEMKPHDPASRAPHHEVPVCRLRATSQELVTTIHPHRGVDMAVHKLMGAQAHLTVYDVAILSETAFTASGNVSFGSTREKPDVLRFTTAGPARILKLKDGERSFTAQFQVHEGESEFEGAEGSLTMNGRLLSLDRVEALVTGVVFKRSALQARRMRVLERTLNQLNLKRPAAPAPAHASGDDERMESDDAADNKPKAVGRRGHRRVVQLRV